VNTTGRYAKGVTLLVALLLGWTPAAAPSFAIPPGQEPKVLGIVGGDDVAGCTLSGAGVQKDHVTARFACGGQTVELAIVHATSAPNAQLRHGDYAIVGLSDHEVPSELGKALVERLRTRPGFTWIATQAPSGPSAAPRDAVPTRELPRPLRVAAIFVLPLVLVGARELHARRRARSGAH